MKRTTKSKILGGSRRTRKVFGVNPFIKLLGYVLIAAVVVMGLYLLLNAEKQDREIKAAEEEKEVVKETKAAVEEEAEEVEKTEKVEIEESIDFDYDHPYGDTSQDSEFSENCKTFINDLKSDIDALYEYKLEVQDSYDEQIDELKRAEEKFDEAKKDLEEKRDELGETRQSCIDTGSPN